MGIKVAKERLGTVGELMSEVVCVVDESATVAEAAQTLASMKVSGAPVVSGERVVGVVSQSDLLAHPEADAAVTTAMNATIYAVRPHDPVMLAARLMVEQQIHRVVVVNDAGELHGMLSSMDVLRATVRAADGLDLVDVVAGS
jgi:CBS domain-containing protein